MHRTPPSVLSRLPASTTAFAVSAILIGRCLGPNSALARAGQADAQAVVRELSLEACLSEAMAHNHRRPASRFAVAAAEAQHRQTLAAYWPQLAIQGGYQRMDEAPNFLFPATEMRVPPQTIQTLPGTATVMMPTAGGVVPVPVAFPGQTITTPAQQFPVPAQAVRLMDPESYTAAMDLKWLLYDGGGRKGVRQQAEAGLAAARNEARRTDLEIADSVTRLYWGAVLSRQVYQLGRDTLARMEATLTLTEAMYKTGGGKVSKADFLDNKVMVETLRAMVALLEKNEALSQAALANTIGMPWRDSVRPVDIEIPVKPAATNLDAMVSAAYEFSPDWARLEAGIKAADGAARTARSGYMPKVALTGSLHKWWNDDKAGIATDTNREGWTAGVGVEIPIFDGFLTRHRLREARARQDQLQEQRILLREGIGLLVKDVMLGLVAATKSHQATYDAMKASEENRELNTRAYQNGLVETEKVIRAQLVEAVMSAQHFKTRFDQVALQSQLGLIVGTEVGKQIQGR